MSATMNTNAKALVSSELRRKVTPRRKTAKVTAENCHADDEA
jgi:hypothetical protein